MEWNFQKAHSKGLLSGPAPLLPQWDGSCEDPLEEVISPSPSEPYVRLGDPVYMRVFHGLQMTVEWDSCELHAKWPQKDTWQEFTFCASAASKPKLPDNDRSPLRDGDVVRIQCSNGRFLAADEEGNVSVVHARFAKGQSCEYVLRTDCASGLRHRGAVWFQNRATGNFLDADEEEHGIYARYNDQGSWQKFHVEKAAASSDEQSSVSKHDALVTLCLPRGLDVPQNASGQRMTPKTPDKRTRSKMLTKTPAKRPRNTCVASSKSNGAPPQKRRRTIVRAESQ